MIEEHVKNWIIKALNDIKVSTHEINLSDDEMTTDVICFHCQQAVEKLLKAFLVSKNVEFGRSHDLELLLKICSEQDNDFKDFDVGNLTDYAVEIRYPEAFYIPSVEEARECFKIALSVKKIVFRKLNIKEKDLS